MSTWSVLGHPSSEHLAKKIAQKLNAKYVKANLRVFPDGESKITVTNDFGNGGIIVVSSMGPPVDSNLFQTLLLIWKARQISSNVIAVVPYMAYAKQDKEFLKGEIVTLKTVAKMLKEAGATKLVVFDFHSKDALKLFKIPTKNISALPLFADYFANHQLRTPLIVAPDLFWKDKAEALAAKLNAACIALNKQRNRKTGKLVLQQPYPKFHKGGDLIIFDDMVSTGGSVIQAIKFLKRKNFRKIIVVCTHPILIRDAEKNLRHAGVSTIIGTNSIEGKHSIIDLSEEISKVITVWK
jgi:ribose-phosphate pyrophosphokinase